jgi:hypothetical protein
MFGRLARRRRESRRGQSMVEFALVFPLFILLLIGLIEFAVMFSITLNVNYASRQAALLAAEVGDAVGGDCLILQELDGALEGATNRSEIEQIRIFWADANGAEKAANVYIRGGSTSCTFADASVVTVPYTATLLNYVAAQRCSVLSGCGVAHPGLDTIGVGIVFHHDWLTPLPNLVQIPPHGVDFTRSNTMRMEPVL